MEQRYTGGRLLLRTDGARERSIRRVLFNGDGNALFALRTGKPIFASASRRIRSHPGNVLAFLLQGSDSLCEEVIACEQPQASGHAELRGIDRFSLEQAAISSCVWSG